MKFIVVYKHKCGTEVVPAVVININHEVLIKYALGRLTSRVKQFANRSYDRALIEKKKQELAMWVESVKNGAYSDFIAVAAFYGGEASETTIVRSIASHGYIAENGYMKLSHDSYRLVDIEPIQNKVVSTTKNVPYSANMSVPNSVFRYYYFNHNTLIFEDRTRLLFNMMESFRHYVAREIKHFKRKTKRDLDNAIDSEIQAAALRKELDRFERLYHDSPDDIVITLSKADVARQERNAIETNMAMLRSLCAASKENGSTSVGLQNFITAMNAWNPSVSKRKAK